MNWPGLKSNFLSGKNLKVFTPAISSLILISLKFRISISLFALIFLLKWAARKILYTELDKLYHLRFLFFLFHKRLYKRRIYLRNNFLIGVLHYKNFLRN